MSRDPLKRQERLNDLAVRTGRGLVVVLGVPPPLPAPWTDTALGTTSNLGPIVPTANGTLVSIEHLCPDLLRHGQLAPADTMRGRVVRAFFWLLQAWRP